MSKNKDIVYKYNDSDLLNMGDFISYCAERDITINDKDLEFYEKRKLVIPIKEYYYSIYQIYPIYWIKLNTDNNLSARFVEFSDEEWSKFGYLYNKVFLDSLEKLYEDLNDFAKDTAIILDLNKLAVENTAKGEMAYIESYKQTKSYRDAIADFSGAIKLSENANPTQLKKLLQEHKITTAHLLKMQEKYIGMGGFKDPARNIYPHLLNIEYFDLLSCKGKLRFALECYGIAENLSWAITVLGEKPLSVTETLLKVKDYRVCINPECQKKFYPKKEIQYSCGEEVCENYYRNLKKRQKRNK